VGEEKSPVNYDASGTGGGGCGGEEVFFFFFPPPLHFNVLMQPKVMKHSMPSTYIDTHRVVLTMYVHSMEKLSA